MVSHETGKVDIILFLELAETIPVVDVRSPSEFISRSYSGSNQYSSF